MRYGGTAAGFTPAEAKAPTLEQPQSTTQPGQNMASLLKREHPVRAGQARQEETETGPRKRTPNSIYRIQTSNQGGNGTTDTLKRYNET
jgi:hypothetical protein